MTAISRFESQLQQLDEESRRGRNSVTAVRLALEALNCLAAIRTVSLFLKEQISSGEEDVSLIATASSGSLSGRATATAEIQAMRVQVGEVVFQASHPVEHPVNQKDAERTQQAASLVATSARQITGTTQSLVCVELETPAADERLLKDAILAITDCLSDQVTRNLLTQLQSERDARLLMEPVVRSFLQSSDTVACATELAFRAPQVLGNVRVSVYTPMETRWTLVAATGTTRMDHKSVAVQQMEQIAKLLTDSGQIGAWIPARAAGTAEDSPLSLQLARAAAAGVSLLRCEQLDLPNNERSQLVLFESFEPSATPDENFLLLLLQSYRDAIRVLPQSANSVGSAGLLSTPLGRTFAVICVVLLVLIFVPARFEIEVPGQLFPAQRQRIFAPDDGIVESVLVTSDQRVAADAILLQLRNPQRDLELNQVLSEIESTSSRLQAVRTTRTTSSPGGVFNNKLSDLSSEEQQLEQKLAALKEEQTLIEEQIASLTMKAPIGGIVYQRRLQQQLTARPVQRGQMLLEIGNDEAQWHLELQVPDAVSGYIREASGQGVPEIEFVRTSDPGIIHVVSLSDIAVASHMEDGMLNCLATASVDRDAVTNPRPGESVTARIDCGRRSLGFVWFRELIEFWQRKKFAWLW